MSDPYRTNAKADEGDDLSKEIRAFLRQWRPLLVPAPIECIDRARCTRARGARFHVGLCTWVGR